MELDVALRRLGGAARWGQLRGLGVPGHVLRSPPPELVICRGALALPGTPPALIAAVRLGGVASHASAAALHGFASWHPDPRVHVTVESGRGRAAGVVVHRSPLAHTDLDSRRPLTSPLRTAVDCAKVMPLGEAVVTLDSAVTLGAVDLDSLRHRADSARGKGAAALRQAVRFVDERAGSPLESATRMALCLLSCELTTQVHIPGVGDVDFLLDGWLVIEPDGFAFHSGRAEYREDRRRWNALTVGRLTTLRFTWEDLRFRLGYVLETVEKTLRMGPRSN
jgi:very-short-patch-repair endonuclease